MKNLSYCTIEGAPLRVKVISIARFYGNYQLQCKVISHNNRVFPYGYEFTCIDMDLYDQHYLRNNKSGYVFIGRIFMQEILDMDIQANTVISI